MGVKTPGVLSPDDLNETDGKVLDVLHQGRVTPQYVAEALDVSRTYASERLKRLVEHNHVDRLASGLYELVDDPRETEYQAIQVTGEVSLLDVTLTVGDVFQAVGPSVVAPVGSTVEIVAFRPGVGSESAGVLFESDHLDEVEDGVAVAYSPLMETAEAVRNRMLERATGTSEENMDADR